MAGGDAANQCQCEIHVNWAKWYKGFMHQVFLHTKMEMKKVLDRKKTAEVREPDGELSITVLVSQTNSRRVQFTMDLTKEAKELKKANIHDLQELKKRIVQVIKYKIRAFHHQDFYDVAPMLIPKIMAEGKGGSLESIVDFANFNFGNIPGTKVAIMQLPRAEGKITALKKVLFDKWGFTGKLAFLLASYNMYRLWTKGEKHFGRDELFETVKAGVYKVKLEEKNKSLAAATLFTMAKFMDDLDVDGDLVIVIPVPSVLLVTGSRNYDGLCYMGQHVLSLGKNKDLITKKPVRLAYAKELRTHEPTYAVYRPQLPKGEGSVPENAEQLQILTDGLSRRARATKLAAANASASASVGETPVDQANDEALQKNVPPPPPSSPRCTEKATPQTTTTARLEEVRKELVELGRTETSSPKPAEKQRCSSENVSQKQSQEVTNKETQATQKQTEEVTQKQETQKKTQEVTQKQTQQVTRKETQVTQKQTQVTQKETQVTQNQAQVTRSQTRQETQKQSVQQKVDTPSAVSSATVPKILTKTETKVSGNATPVPSTKAPPGGVAEGVTLVQRKQDGGDIAVKKITGQGDQPPMKATSSLVSTVSKDDTRRVLTSSATPNGTEPPKMTSHTVTNIISCGSGSSRLPITAESATLAISVSPSSISQGLATVKQQVQPSDGLAKPAEDRREQPMKRPVSSPHAPKQTNSAVPTELLSTTTKQIFPAQTSLGAAQENMQSKAVIGKQNHVEETLKFSVDSQRNTKWGFQENSTMQKPLPSSKNVQQAPISTSAAISVTASSVTRGVSGSASLKPQLTNEKLDTGKPVATPSVVGKVATSRPMPDLYTPMSVSLVKPFNAKTTTCSQTNDKNATSTVPSCVQYAIVKPVVTSQAPETTVPSTQLRIAIVKPTVSTQLSASDVKSAVPEKVALSSKEPPTVAKPLQQPTVKSAIAPQMQSTDVRSMTSSQMLNAAAKSPGPGQVESTSAKKQVSSKEQPVALKTVVDSHIPPAAATAARTLPVKPPTVQTPTLSQHVAPKQMTLLPVQTDIPKASIPSQNKLAVTVKSVTPTTKQIALDSTAPTGEKPGVLTPAMSSAIQSTAVQQMTSSQAKNKDAKAMTPSTIPSPASKQIARVQEIASSPSHSMTSSQTEASPVRSLVADQMQATTTKQDSSYRLQSTASKSLPSSVLSACSITTTSVQVKSTTVSSVNSMPVTHAKTLQTQQVELKATTSFTKTDEAAHKQVTSAQTPTKVPKPTTMTKPQRESHKMAASIPLQKAASKQVGPPALPSKPIISFTSKDVPSIKPSSKPVSSPDAKVTNDVQFLKQNVANQKPATTLTLTAKQPIGDAVSPSSQAKHQDTDVTMKCPDTSPGKKLCVKMVPYVAPPPTGLHGPTIETLAALEKQQQQPEVPTTTAAAMSDASATSSAVSESVAASESSTTIAKSERKIVISTETACAKDVRAILNNETMFSFTVDSTPEASLKTLAPGAVPEPTAKADPAHQQSLGQKVNPEIDASNKLQGNVCGTEPVLPSNEKLDATVPTKSVLSVKMVPYKPPTKNMIRQSVPPLPCDNLSDEEYQPAIEEVKTPSPETARNVLENDMTSQSAPHCDYLEHDREKIQPTIGEVKMLSSEPARNGLLVKMVPYKPQPPVKNDMLSQAALPGDNLEHCKDTPEPATDDVKQQNIQDVASLKSDHDLPQNGTAVGTKIHVAPNASSYKKESLNPTAPSFNSMTMLDTASIVTTEPAFNASVMIEKPSFVATETEKPDRAAQQASVNTTPQIQYQGQRTSQQRPQTVYPGTTNRNGLDHSEGARPKEQAQMHNGQIPHRNPPQYQHPSNLFPNQSWHNHGEPLQAHQPTWDRGNNPDAARSQEQPRTAERGQTTKEKLASAFKPLADKFQQFKQWRKNKNQPREEPYVPKTYNLGHQVQEGMGDVPSHVDNWQGFEGNLQYPGQVNGFHMPPADQQGTARDLAYMYEQRRWYQEQASLHKMRRELLGAPNANGPVQMSGQMFTGQNDNSHYGQHNMVNPVIKTKTAYPEVPQQQQWSQNAAPNDYQRYSNPERTGPSYQQQDSNYHVPVVGNPSNGAITQNYRGRHVSEPNHSHIQNTMAQRFERMSQNSNQDIPARDTQRPANNARSGDSGVRRSASFSRPGPRPYRRMPKGSSGISGEPVQQPEMQTWIGGGRVTNLPTGTTPPRYYRNRANSHSYVQNRPHHMQTKPVEKHKAEPSPPKPPAKKYKPTTQPERVRRNTLTKGSHTRQASSTASSQAANQEKSMVERKPDLTENLDPSIRPKTPKIDEPSQDDTTKPEQIEDEKNEVDEEEERRALKARRRLQTQKPSDAQKSRPAKIPRIPVFLGAIDAGVREEAWNRALVTAEEDPVGTSLCVQLCFYCGVVGSWNEDVVLRKCSKCSTASYCSRKCQWNHWNQHKSKCRNLTSDHQKFKVIIQL
ncbi:uncharacterized protein LOC144887815 [Branchiostoma floridae x Branchiostoma japonicum]